MITVFLFSCGDKKEEVQPQPTIGSLSISEGVVGTNVTITGTNFGTLAADVEVTFNNTKAVVTNVTPTAIATTVPTGATSGNVNVKVKLLQASGPSFTVLAPITVSALPLSVTVNENLSVGALVGTLSATTNRGNLIYSLASQSVAGAMSINSTSGILTVANATAFDFEVNPTITAVASVANGTETATANITVTLNNVTDVALGNFSTTVAENQANSAVIGTMNVLTGAGAFAITTQTPMGALAVNATTGQLTVANSASFDFEVNPTITATVSISGGSEVKTASVTVTLTNVEEVTTSNLTASIAENPAANAVIGTVAATIPVGVGGTIAYAITTQSPAGAMAINTSTGQLTVATVSSFDFETNPTITATVSATNKSEVKNASVTITLTNVVDVATISSLSTNASEASTIIVIKGENFGTVLSNVKVLFNTIEVDPTAITNTEVTVTVPSNAVSGQVKVKVSEVESNGTTFKVLPSNGLIGKYLFSGDASDAQSSNIGTVSGASLVTDRFNNAASAYSFDGVNDNINLGDLTAYRFGTGDFTVSLWFQFTESQLSAMLSKQDPNPNYEQYSLFIASSGNATSSGTKAGFFVNTSNFNTRTSASGPYNDGLWHNLVLVTSYTGSTTMYIDNVLNASAATAFTGTISSVNQPLMIGSLGSNRLYFKGKIDDVRIYNRALAADEF